MLRFFLLKLHLGLPQKDVVAAGRARGFTLLELLIVIALLAILAVVVVLVLNPAETLRRARDSQRISDMSSLKSAIGLYLTDVSIPDLDAAVTANCDDSADAIASIFWGGAPSGGTDITDTTVATADGAEHVNAGREAAVTVSNAGWVPVNFTSITGGSPIGSLPIDPNYLVGAAGAVVDTDRLYIFACEAFTFEVNANMEAARNSTDAGAIELNDGGDDTLWAEFGTDLTILNNL